MEKVIQIFLKCEKCGFELPDKYRYGRTHGTKCPKCKEGKMNITQKDIDEKILDIF